MMKKILAFAILSMISLNCMARSITIKNNSSDPVMVQDNTGDSIANINANSSATLPITGSPSEILVQDNATYNVYTTDINSKVKIVTISSDFTLSTAN